MGEARPRLEEPRGRGGDWGRFLLAFEYAEKITDEAAKAAAMTFVIIGGGPTGVEMAGAIAEISATPSIKIFGISTRRARG